MADTVAQIKSRLNLADVLGGYLKLQKAGANFKARCPFHNEKTPSFHINVERQIWHCFGCSKGGDVFTFVQDIEGIEFVEALRILAARAGVPLERERPGERAERSRRGVLLKATELATAFFVKQLWYSDAGKRALEYLRERGLQDDTIRAWRLGWAPNDWQALNTFLTAQGLGGTDVAAAGLVSERSGRLYDRFRGRIMFPVCDHNGQVVGFAGRIFGRPEGEHEPKYINTPQTALYDKGRVLFGLDKAKLAVRAKDSCVLVEGNMDAVLSWQAGVQNAVATSGTALTADQLRLVGRYSTNLDFCFDADQAGAAATRRGISLALAARMNVRIALLDDPECKDPADYVRKHGAGWDRVVSAAKPAVQYYLDRAMESYDPASAQSKREVILAVGPLVKRLTSRVETSHWVSRLATVLRVAPADVQADLASLKDDLAAVAPEPDEPGARDVVSSVSPVTPPDPLEQALLSLLMKDFTMFRGQLASLDRSWITPKFSAILDDLVSADGATFSWDDFIKKHDDGSWHLEFAYVKAHELWEGTEAPELMRQWQFVVSRLGARLLERKASVMEMDIKDAEERKDASRLKALLADFTNLKQSISRLFRV